MAAESVKVEVLGISSEAGGDREDGLSIVESKREKDLDLVAEESGEPARVVLKDVELENSGESSEQDGGGMTDEGAAGTSEYRAEGAAATSEEPGSEEGEQEECGFCLFMKAGPCGERFSIWQNCVDAAEKAGEDIVEKCAQTTSLLKVCMEMNLEYYGPVLDAEKAMEDVAAQDENQAADSAGNAPDQEKATQGGASKDENQAADSDRKTVGQSRDTSENDNADSGDGRKVVEVVGVTSVDGKVTEVVDVVVETAN